MFAKLASVITETQAGLGQIQEDDKELQKYGLEIGLSIVAYVLVIALIGLFSRSIFEAIIFAAVFLCIRSYAGGYHAPSGTICFFASIIITVAALALAHVCQGAYQAIFAFLCWVVGSVLILRLAPVDSPNKPLDELEVKVYGKRTRIVLAIVSAALVVFQILKLYTIASIVSIAIILVGASVVLGCAQQQKTKPIS